MTARKTYRTKLKFKINVRDQTCNLVLLYVHFNNSQTGAEAALLRGSSEVIELKIKMHIYTIYFAF
jgi:hypothetical protein